MRNDSDDSLVVKRGNHHKENRLRYAIQPYDTTDAISLRAQIRVARNVMERNALVEGNQHIRVATRSAAAARISRAAVSCGGGFGLPRGRAAGGGPRQWRHFHCRRHCRHRRRGSTGRTVM